MTEHEYVSKHKMLKQIRQNISDLKQQEQSISRTMAQYEFEENIKGNCYNNEDAKMLVKPMHLRGESVVAYIIDYELDFDAYAYMKRLCVEEGIFDIEDFSIMNKISGEEFNETVEELMDYFCSFITERKDNEGSDNDDIKH